MKSILKLLAVFLLGVFSFQAEASHVIGGDIQYQYLGNNNYHIKLVIYRQQTGATLGTTQTVQVVSASCGVSTSATLSLTYQGLAQGAWDCIQPNATVFVPEVNVFETTSSNPLHLTSRCSDYKISWNLCCRPGGITNIGTGGASSAGYGFYFEAELNNRLGIGNNTSPTFNADPIAYYCSNTFINYSQNVSEPDGDSIRYELIDPRENFNGTIVPYAAGFDKYNPFTTDPNYPYTLDPKTGNLSFMATVGGEVSVLALRVDEYRFDSTYFFWEKVGSSNREIQVVIGSPQYCQATAAQGVKLDPNAPGVSFDSQGRQQKDYNCYDSTVTLQFTLPVECISVAPDGTDFRLTAPNGQPIPVKSVRTYCNNNNETDSLTLILYKPLLFNGDYFLYSKYGTDGNTLLNKCGKPMDEFDTIILKVNDCLNPDYGVIGVSVDEDRRNRIDYFIDTNTIPVKYLDFIRIYRSDDSGRTYNQINTGNPLLGSIYDANPGPGNVDNQYYYYSIDLIANGQAAGISEALHTICLKGDLTDKTNIPLYWSSYAGLNYNDFNNLQYQLQLGTEQDTGGYIWTNWTVNYPIKDSAGVFAPGQQDPGNYALRIITLPDANGYSSESNWLLYGVPVVPVIPPDAAPPLTVPDVMTPNADGLNDKWTINGIDSWNSATVSIFDRWGRKVWSSDRYLNATAFEGKDSNGQDLADGTYFYTITLDHPQTYQHEVLNGSLSIMRGN